MKSFKQLLGFKLLIAALFSVLALSAHAASLSQIKGEWESVRQYSKTQENLPDANHYQMKMNLQLKDENQFSMIQELTFQNTSSHESTYQGTYVFAQDQILTSATSLQVQFQGGQKQMDLNPPSQLLLTVVRVDGDLMTLQMGGEDLYIDFKRAVAAPDQP